MFANRTRYDTTQLSEPVPDALGDAARVYLDRGWSCIPLVGKQPGVASWKEYQYRLPSSGELGDWFISAKHAPTGLGIITGKLSGLVVADCDTPEDAEYWLGRFPTSPLMVETGRGGVHVYYKASSDESVRNRVKVFRRQIDVRGEGGYVAAPPSWHPSGRRYVWTTTGVDLQQPLPSFDPAWLAASEVPDNPRTTDLSSTSFRNVAAYIHRIHAKSGDGGHNATFRAACKLRDAGLSPEDALTALVQWNMTNAHPPWSTTELSHKIESAYQVGGGWVPTA